MGRHIIYTDTDYHRAFDNIAASQLRVVDTETTGLTFHEDYIVGVCVWALGESYYFPFRHFEGRNLPEPQYLLSKLGQELHRPYNLYGKPTQIVGFNYQYDAKMWLAEDVPMPEVWEDPILMAHLCNENEKAFKMEYLAERYVDETAGEDEAKLIAAIKKRFPTAPEKGIKKYLCYLDPEIVGQYGMQDVETTLDLYGFYVPWLKWQGLYKLYKQIRYFAKQITKMEVNGFKLDRERLEINSKGAVEEAARLKKVLSGMAGHVVNPGSPKQMKTLLGVGSTKRDLLETAPGVANTRIRGAKELLDWRQYTKAEGTYYEPFRKLVSKDGFIHTNLRMVGGWQGADEKGGTVSGRLSAQHPNMQAIKRGTGERYSVRDVFVARPGRRLLEVDYSQAELRLATHYAKVPQMLEMFRQGIDVHGGVAKELGIPRSIAKNVNFSFLYGIGPKSFGEKYHMSYADAKAYLTAYDGRYPGFRRLLSRAELFAKRNGYVEMWTGRRRHFNTKNTYPKDAMNNLIQGGVGEMIRYAITDIGNAVDDKDALMVLTVHDSIMLEPIDDDTYIYEQLIPVLREIMEPQPWCSVPIVVDFKEGYRWGEMKEVAL